MTPVCDAVGSKSLLAPSEVAAGAAAGRFDGEAARFTLGRVCAACGGDEDVRRQDESEDVVFCDDCVEGARTPILDTELGGES